MSDNQFQPLTYTGTITIASSDSTADGTVTLGYGGEGLMKHLSFVTPDMEDTDSTKIEIKDSSATYEYFDSGTQAESSTVLVGSEVALSQGDLVIATAEGTQSADRSVTFQIRGVR